MYQYTKNLNELSKDSLPEAGGKGANLGELMQVDIPVPPGFVVTTAAYRTQLEESGLRERIVNRLVELEEYGVPCVVDIPNIKALLKDGHKIRVDGTKGKGQSHNYKRRLYQCLKLSKDCRSYSL
jgi:hypothetical protein